VARKVRGRGAAAWKRIGEEGAVERDASERDAGECDTGERDADVVQASIALHAMKVQPRRKAQAQLVRLRLFGIRGSGFELSSFRHAQVARVAWWC
jgi:hypothetical protein